MSFTGVGKSCPSREFLKWQICLLRLFAKIKVSQKFPNLQYAQMSLINAHADISSETRGLNFGLSIYQLPYFMCASSKGSGYSAQMRRLV